MFQFTWPLCTPPMFKFGPRGFQNWFYIHCSSNQKKVPSAQTFFAPNRSKLGKWTIQNHCDHHGWMPATSPRSQAPTTETPRPAHQILPAFLASVISDKMTLGKA